MRVTGVASVSKGCVVERAIETRHKGLALGQRGLSMTRDHGHPSDAPRPPSDEEQSPQPRRPFDRVRDYMKLARFRMDYGGRHNAQAYWAEHGHRDHGGHRR
jgi:hypothetical protein